MGLERLFAISVRWPFLLKSGDPYSLLVPGEQSMFDHAWMVRAKEVPHALTESGGVFCMAFFGVYLAQCHGLLPFGA